VRPGTTIIRVEDSEINYLLTHCAFGVAVPRRYLAKTPTICGPFEEYVLPQHLLSSRVKGLPCGGADAGWKPGGSKIGEKSSLLSDDWAA